MDHLVSEKFLKTKFSLCEVGVIYSDALHCGNTGSVYQAYKSNSFMTKILTSDKDFHQVKFKNEDDCIATRVIKDWLINLI